VFVYIYKKKSLNKNKKKFILCVRITKMIISRPPRRIVISKLADEEKKILIGSGILGNLVGKVREWIVPKTLSSRFKSTLSKYGPQKITKILIAREPVIGMVQKVVNWISGGEYEKKRKQLNYDQVYHLFALITLADGTVLKLEKNAIPQITVNPGKHPKDFIAVSSPGNTLMEFIGKTIQRMGETNYVRYDAATLNCQNFIQNHLQANGISSSEATKFIMQEADKLLTGNTRSIAKAITDIAATATQAIGGRKKRRIRVPTGRPRKTAKKKNLAIKIKKSKK
jgi:hypothetical protein